MQPPPAYAQLRAENPVAAVVTAEGHPAWLVTSYDAVATVLSDPRFTVTPPGAEESSKGTLLQDGDEHARLRRLVGKAFTARSVTKLRPRVAELAARQTTVVADSDPPADLVSTFAAPLSIAVISELLGVSIDERDHFRDLADAASAADPFVHDAEAAATAARTWGALSEFCTGLIAAKRRNRGDDLLSVLIDVRDAEDGRLGDDELTSMVTTIVAAGYLTACNAMTVGVIQLLRSERMRGLADAEPDNFDAVVEEVLRLQTGLTGEPFPRWAREDVTVEGTRVAAGDLLLVRLGAASRDPAHFADPDRLALDRADRPHFAFGRGPHHCLGAALARIEVGAALRALSQQFPALQLHGCVDDVVWTRSHADAGPKALHVSW